MVQPASKELSFDLISEHIAPFCDVNSRLALRASCKQLHEKIPRPPLNPIGVAHQRSICEAVSQKLQAESYPLNPVVYSKVSDVVCAALEISALPGSVVVKIGRFVLSKLVAMIAQIPPLANVFFIPIQIVASIIGSPTEQNMKVWAIASPILSVVTFTALSSVLFTTFPVIALGIHSVAMTWFLTGTQAGGMLGINSLGSILKYLALGENAQITYPSLTRKNLEKGSVFSSINAGVTQAVVLAAMLYMKKELILAITVSQLSAACVKALSMKGYYAIYHQRNMVLARAQLQEPQ